jgi:hypothetical protein
MPRYSKLNSFASLLALAGCQFVADAASGTVRSIDP